MRIALHSVIAEGAIDDYRTHHARVPDGLRDLFGVAGIEDWTIWRSGRNLFHIVECEDFDAAMRWSTPRRRTMRGRPTSAVSSRGSTGPTGRTGSLRSSRCGRCRRSGVTKAEICATDRYLLDTRSACG